MGNKDEKTFTDLFASSTNEQDKKPITFGTILNENVSESATNAVTFDNLLGQISSEADTSNTREEIQITKVDSQQEETIGVTNLNFNTLNVEKNNDFNSFFNNIQPAIDSKESEQINEHSEIETNIENSINEPNPFFNQNDKTISDKVQEEIIQDKNIETNNITINPFIESNTEPDHQQLESTTTNQETLVNPFFDESPINNLTSSSITTETTNISLESSKETNVVVNKETIDNPFFADSPTNNSINNNSTTETANISQELPTKDNTVVNQEIVINPFFDNKPQESSVATNYPLSEPKIEKTESLPTDTKKAKSSSPFFEEPAKTEANPFFQNQLNLIENQNTGVQKSNIDTSNTKHYNVKVVKKKEPLIKFIIGVLSYALFIFLLLIGITLLIYVLDIKIKAAKGDYTTPKFNAYVVLTGSMLPEIKVYDVVVTKKIDAKDLKEGDVITFASADSRFLGTIITHRIIKKNPPSGTEGYTFQTRGDNNNVADSALVPEQNIFGKVILKIPKLGYLQEFLASDGGWIIVILIPCLTVISYDTVKLIKGLKRKQYKNIKVQK